MNNAIRIVLLLIGFVALALPGGCSWWFTPAVFWSLQEPDPFGSSRPLIADTLLFWPLGLATALGGYRLLQGAWRRDLSAPAPRWLLTGAGLLLLMSAGSIVVCGHWDICRKCWSAGRSTMSCLSSSFLSPL